MLRALLSLPASALRALSGGVGVTMGGRTLDPRFQLLASRARGQPPLANLPPQAVRVGSASSLALMSGRPEKGVEIEALSVPGGIGPTAARVYLPADRDPASLVMVWGHFGGGVIGDLETCHAFCTILAKEAHCPVLSIAYRLAPEHRFPAGLEDMLLAYRWAREHAERFGSPAGRAAVGGDSMGGNFAAVVAQEMRRAGDRQPEVQLLIYPALDLAASGGSMATYAKAWPLSAETMAWFMTHYLREEDSPTDDPRLSPLRAASLEGLAPAVIATAGFDPLLDQGESYARRLREAGVSVSHHCYDHLPHAFTAFTGVSPEADLACREIARLTRNALSFAAAATA